MDPLQPIAGIDIEQYARMCAAMVDLPRGDWWAQVAVAQGFGVDGGRWHAASHGWTARLADPGYRARVAPVFRPLYEAAVARRRGELTPASAPPPPPRGPGLLSRLLDWL